MTFTEGEQRDLAQKEEMMKDKGKKVVGGPDKDFFLAPDNAKLVRDGLGGSGVERESMYDAKEGKEKMAVRLMSNEEGNKGPLVYSRKNRKLPSSGRVSEGALPDSDGLFSAASKKSRDSGRHTDISEINERADVIRDTGRKESRTDKKEKSNGKKMVMVMNPTPVSYVSKKGPRSEFVQGAFRASVEKSRGMMIGMEESSKGKVDVRSGRGSRLKVKVERGNSGEEEEELAVKKRRLLESKIRKSKRELKALYGGISPDAGILEKSKACKGIASRIGSRVTRSRRGAKALMTSPVKINIVDTDSDEEEIVKSTALVIHEGNLTSDTYLSDDRVFSRDYDDDDGEENVMVDETQEVASSGLVDTAVMRKVARSIGISKQELSRKVIKNIIEKVVSEIQGGEGEDLEALGEDFIGTTEEERMIEEGKFSWSSKESGFGEGSDDEDAF